MQLNIQGLELLCKKNSCLSGGELYLGSELLLKHNRYELLPNLSCSNVSSCLIGAVSLRIHLGFFLTDITLPSKFLALLCRGGAFRGFKKCVALGEEVPCFFSSQQLAGLCVSYAQVLSKKGFLE